MKKGFLFKGALFVLFAGIVLFSNLSCNVGMGESVDLTAPVLSIIYPRHGALTPKNVTIKGTASDDRKLTGVEVKYTYKKGGETITGSKMAQIDGVNWSRDFSFDGDYEVEFEAFAYDVNRNGSDTSHERVMILIDSENPGVQKMSIVRGNYIARIIDLERFIGPVDFKTALRNESQNKDYFQNEYLKILSNLSDKYGIGEVFLDLYEINPDTRAQTLVYKDLAPSNDTNKYSPEFTITEAMFSALPRGSVHYIMPHLRVKDEAGNFSDRVDGVFAWEPEYNTPHVSFNAMQNGEIQVPQGAPIIVSIFDDDDLASYDSWLVPKGSYDAESVKAAVGSLTKIKSGVYTENGMRSTAFEIDSAGTDSNNADLNLGQYWLIVKVVDKSSKADSEFYFKATPVRITNQDAPMIFVTSPTDNNYNDPATENVVPSLDTNNEFTFRAKVIDNEKDVDIAIAWLGPNAGSTQISNFETYFKTYTFGGSNSGMSANGGKVWDIAKVTPPETSPNYTYKFEKKFKFFDDFKVNNQVDNTAKVFMIAAKDPTGNITTKTFRYNAMPSSIKFKVEYKYNNGTSIDVPNPLVTLAPASSSVTGAYDFTITPSADNGIKIESSTITKSATTNGFTALESGKDNNGYKCSFTIPNASAISGKTMEFTIVAFDQLGNKLTQKLTVLFDTVGTLTTIEGTSNKDKVFVCSDDKYDGTIRLQANFSGKVSLQGATNLAYIQLDGNWKDKDNGTISAENRRATYVSGNETNTLYFEYKVPKGIEASGIKISSTANPIVCPTGVTFEGNQNTYTNNVNSKNYAIDSIAPYITAYLPSKNSYVLKENGSVDIKLTFNENVFVESGTIVMQRADKDWYIPPVLSEDVFTKIWNTATSGDRVTLCDSSDDVKKTTTDSLVPVGPYMQYTNGLKSGTGYDANGNKNVANCLVPDTDTKFVLAYDYNIADTTAKGVVANIRKVLETHNYHKSEFEATVVSVNNNIVTLNVKDSDWVGGLVNGVEYFLTITEGVFRDKAYNYADEIKKDDYKFWVGPVATPIIRVNRKTTNATTDAPSSIGKTKFKIDCETPGASISYGTQTNQETGKTTEDADKSIHTWVADITKTDFDAITLGKTVTVNGTYEIPDDEAIGGEPTTAHLNAQKIYISAKAAKTIGANTVNSAVGKEGAFKTVLHYYYDNGKTANKIFGAESPEGAAFTAGFPLTQNKMERYGYQIPYAAQSGKDFYWVSWQIVSDFTLQVRGGSPGGENFQDPADPAATYGQYIYCKNKDHYGA